MQIRTVWWLRKLPKHARKTLTAFCELKAFRTAIVATPSLVGTYTWYMARRADPKDRRTDRQTDRQADSFGGEPKQKKIGTFFRAGFEWTRSHYGIRLALVLSRDSGLGPGVLGLGLGSVFGLGFEAELGIAFGLELGYGQHCLTVDWARVTSCLLDWAYVHSHLKGGPVAVCGSRRSNWTDKYLLQKFFFLSSAMELLFFSFLFVSLGVFSSYFLFFFAAPTSSYSSSSYSAGQPQRAVVFSQPQAHLIFFFMLRILN